MPEERRAEKVFVYVTYKGIYKTTEVMKSGRHGSVFEATIYWVRNADAPGDGTGKTRKGADEVPRGRPGPGLRSWSGEA